MTVDEFAMTIQSLAKDVRSKPPEEALKIIIETFETRNLDIEQIKTILNQSPEDIAELQADVMLVLKFAMKSKESMKHELQDIKTYRKARDSYNNHSAS